MKAARSITLLGTPAIRGTDGRKRALRGHQAWALLARVLLARAPLDRRSLSAELFSETADPLGALRWCLASLRKALDCPTCLTGDPLERRFPDDINVDLWSLDREDFDIETAGPLLGNIEPRCSPEFSTWLLVERERINALLEARLRQETIREVSVENYDRAIRLAELAVRRSPYDERAHVLLVKSLAMAGRHAAAEQHAANTEQMFLSELGERPSSALRSAARRTISAPPSGISQEAFISTLIQSGVAALAAGALGAGVDCLRRATAEAENLKGGPLFARATLELGIAFVHSVCGQDDEGSVLLFRSIELARAAGEPSIAAAAYRELGYVEARAGRRPTAAQYLSEALNLAWDQNDLAGIHAVTGFNLVDWGRAEQGIEHYLHSLEHARSAGNRRREIWSLGLGAWGMMAAGRQKDADQWLDECLKLVDEQNWIAFRPWPVALQGESRLCQGRPPGGVRPDLEQAFALSCQLEDPCWEGAVARTMALTYADENDFGTAMEWLTEGRRRCARETDCYMGLYVEILADLSETARQQGRTELADSFSREWVSQAARTHMDTHVARAAAFIGQR